MMTLRSVSASPPKVSIGLPVYNGARYVREALDSLLAQTFTDFELIVSDNASTDETEGICREYAARDSRIRYIRQPVNRGAMGNFLFVLEEARGPYFMWAAGDDRWDPRWVGALVSQHGPGVVVAFGSVTSFEDDGRSERPVALKSLTCSLTLRLLTYYAWDDWGAKPNVIYGLYRTSELRAVAFSTVGQANPNRFGVDIILVFSMLRMGTMRIEPGVMFYKRARHDVIQSWRSRPLSWRSAVALAASLLKLDWLPYLFEHIRRSPPGIARAAVAVATVPKYAWFVVRGMGPLARFVFRRIGLPGSPSQV